MFISKKEFEAITERLARLEKKFESHVCEPVKEKVTMEHFKNVVGEVKKNKLMYYIDWSMFGQPKEKDLTVFETIEKNKEEQDKKITAIEKYLGIKYVIEESKFEGYKSTKNPKTNKKPVI